LTYASISRNLSIGLGSFWHPYYWNDSFYGHPPLFFGLESLAFGALGDSIWIEKSVSLFLNLWIFISFFPILRWINPRLDRWLIATSWAILPLVCWAAGAHILDTPLTLTTFWAVGLAYHPERKGKAWPGLASGFLIGLSVGIKGPVGLFPFLVYLLTSGDRRKKIKFLIQQLLGFLLLAVPVFLGEEGRNFFFHYLEIQVVGSMEETHRGSFFQHGLQCFLPLVVARILVTGSFRIPRTVWTSWGKVFLVLLPLLLSGKQHDYYWLPFLPWMAIATFSDEKSMLISNKSRPITWFLFLFMAAEIWWHTGEKERDREQILAMEKFSKFLPDGSLVGHQPPLDQDWVWIAYGIRYHRWWNRGMPDVTFYFSTDSTNALASSGKYHLKKVPLKHE
jgi:4-amino-4-deoxy-L-arabinose transferase-like glycosyltransferase